MRLPKFHLLQPETLKEACSILGEHRNESVLLAGGTALLVDLKQRLRKPGYVVSMKGVTGWDYIRLDEHGGVSIGALASVENVTGSPVIAERYPVLAQAARSISVPPLRHVATVGGNLALDTRCIYYNQSDLWRQARPPCLKLGGDVCHLVEKGRRCLAIHQGDLAPALMALGAKVVLMRAVGERLLPLRDFFTGNGEKPNVLGDGELLAEVRIPSSTPNGGGAYEKLRVREAMDFPLVSAAVNLAVDGRGVIERASVVLGAVAAAPLEVTEAAAALSGQKIGQGLEVVIDQVAQMAFERAHPGDTLAVDAAYRRKMTRVMVRRAQERAIATAQGA